LVIVTARMCKPSMARSQAKNTQAIKVVDELNGWITPKKAATILELELASMSAIIHAGKLDAVKISSVVLVSKESVEQYAKVREKAKQESEAKILARADKKLAQSHNRKLKEVLANMSLEEIDALLTKA